MAPDTLTPQQKHALELTYTCFRGVAAFVPSVENSLESEEKLVAKNLRDLARVCQHRLVEAFPELLEWFKEWER